MSLTSWIYQIMKIGRDINAVKKDKVGQRVGRRLAGKGFGKAMGKLFK